MFIKTLEIKNYRTIENIKISFDGNYTAISGKNNAGKSNILRAIKTILHSGFNFRIRGHSIMGISNFNRNEEITSWKSELKEDITISTSLEISEHTDTEIFKYVTDFIIQDSQVDYQVINQKFILTISFIIKPNNEEHYNITINNISLDNEYKIKELIKRLRSAECLSFHNSTKNMYSPFEDSIDRIGDFIVPTDSKKISKKKEELLNIIGRSLKNHQQQLTNWLGKLEDKYTVTLTVQGLDFEREPIDISLKEKGGNVSLDNWGSGTRNRTLIFLKIFNAVKRANNNSETERIKPIIIIEEPESFLHPQAQAEFSRILQDMANELDIQIIVTTHSPYFLSIQSPSNNILLKRGKNNKNPSTSLITPNNQNWWLPFIETLGIKGEDFGPMKDIIFNKNENILIVEGNLDKQYLEYLQSDIHGSNALRTDIEIVPINGITALDNTVWLSYIRKKFNHVCILIDLDLSSNYITKLESVGFKKGKNIFIAGTKNYPCIEGYVPPNVLQDLLSQNYDISCKLLNHQKAKEARKEIKQLLLRKIVKNQITQDMQEFYNLAKIINTAYK